jgi:hypothetical protein
VSFLPGLSGGYEHDLVEPEASGYFAGGDQVAVVNRIKRATHYAQSVRFVRLGTALPGQPCRARGRGDHALAVRATLADRPGDQQQDQEDAERENSKGPGRNWQLTVRLGLEERQSQGHTRSVAVQSSWWVTQLVRPASA